MEHPGPAISRFRRLTPWWVKPLQILLVALGVFAGVILYRELSKSAPITAGIFVFAASCLPLFCAACLCAILERVR